MKKTAAIILITVCIILAAVLFVSNRERLIQKDVGKPGPVHEAEKKYPPIRETDEKKVHKIKGEIAPPAEGSKVPAVAPRAVTVERGYNDTHREVINFFHYLDQKDYIKAYRLKEGTYKHFLKLIEKLSANPPTVSGELQDIYILTHNIAHFYRVIGEKDISLIKDILSNEKKITEQTMELLYEWITKEIENKKKEIKITTKDLYEYAAFFLKTMGGKTYLSRRDSRTRILVTYYSILILNKANEVYLNRHGVDIRPHLTLLLEDIHNQKNLNRKTEYLKKLNAIKKNLMP
jgi:hypothetical protein